MHGADYTHASRDVDAADAVKTPSKTGRIAQVQAPRPDRLRFQVVLNQPVATPDLKSVVAGTSALVLRDRDTGQCYVVVTIGNSTAMSTAACQP